MFRSLLMLAVLLVSGTVSQDWEWECPESEDVLPSICLRHSMESYGYRFKIFLIDHQSLIIWIITVIGGLLSIYFWMTHYSEVEKLRIIKDAEVKISIATIEGKTNQLKAEIDGKTNQLKAEIDGKTNQLKAEIDGKTERIKCAIENFGKFLQAVITPFAKLSEIVEARFFSKKDVEKLRIIKDAEVKIAIATIEGKTNQLKAKIDGKTNQSKAEIDGNTERINCAIENGGNLLQAVITPFAKKSEIVAKTAKAVALAALKK